ncbi:MAG: hypothetical protein WDA10_15430, partial [Porticoccaceae bacterium]
WAAALAGGWSNKSFYNLLILFNLQVGRSPFDRHFSRLVSICYWLSVAATSNPYKKPFKKFSPAQPGSSGLCRRNDPACRQNSPSLNRQGETYPPKSRGLVTLPDTQIGETAHVVQPW